LKDRAKLRASLRDDGGGAAGELSRRAPPVSQRLTALRAAKPRDDASSIFSHLLRDDGGGAAGESIGRCGAGESETHRTAGGTAAGGASLNSFIPPNEMERISRNKSGLTGPAWGRKRAGPANNDDGLGCHCSSPLANQPFDIVTKYIDVAC
jgi:hypothetical protein